MKVPQSLRTKPWQLAARRSSAHLILILRSRSNSGSSPLVSVCFILGEEWNSRWVETNSATARSVWVANTAVFCGELSNRRQSSACFLHFFSVRQLPSPLNLINFNRVYSKPKRPLGRPRRRWEDNIKMDLQEVRGGGDWMELAQDRDRWRALVNTLMYFRVP